MGNPAARPRQRRPSIKTVAALAGVSWSTVSNVINNHPSVRPETRARVEEAIDALGYRPNNAGRSLRKGTTGTVLLTVSDLTRPVQAETVQALVTECRNRGLSAVIETLTGTSEAEWHLLAQRHAANSDGIIHVRPVRVPPRSLSTGVPAVVVDPVEEPSTGLVVACDAGAQMKRLVAALLEEGPRRLSLVAEGGRTASADVGRFVEALDEAGQPAGAGSVLLAHEDSWAAGEALARGDSAPRAGQSVVCASEELALGLLAGLRETGTQDVRVAALSVSRCTLEREPGLTATWVDAGAVACAALDLVLVDPTEHRRRPPFDVRRGAQAV
ncbi:MULTISPECIES: LacI family DNA-binding transcriptional regulator [unclassified Actinomyces]|uniref:LacI family DNA-binding transcriptional regulator n=1 Tax=unclassified Actinomyces TaxID=2609248 RepID=UPI002016AD62|nr:MULTISPECIES: LacI family DNA-binding transcriptional regulator [unclassified Actinomyces]MCL3778687.1 LacI family DNA-binding transcriptional regulator [Actinomyces sp. AC-20-1]MCL3789968.1 LacI family DNA-binding transcriptional regulator [Actinomyces sp. 187325]MCL3792313.1 LacI family DNA-binding transcriptional regulator [Actinomyces sp. 186855]MCL3794509.1 LacI family DNA-binding transcriptional regulator [Actinomyces sp. 217892]